jgi:carnitine 3-dehydrogenase
VWREIVSLIARGVLDVSDANDVVYWGLGLRWAAIELSIHSHLAGGPGGIRGFIDSLGGQPTGAAEDRARAEWTPELKQEIVRDALRHVGGRSLYEIARQRDDALVDLLKERIRRQSVRTSKSARFSKLPVNEDPSNRDRQDS